MIRILSDLHCGHPASLIRNFDQIEPLLEGARTIVFNGDTVEFRLSEGRERGQELLEELGRFCCDRDVEAIFLNGNHDPDASERNFLKLLGGKVLVTHGDLFFEAISPWSRGAKTMKNFFEKYVRGISKSVWRWCVGFVLNRIPKKFFVRERCSVGLDRYWKNLGTRGADLKSCVRGETDLLWRPILRRRFVRRCVV